MDDEMWDDDVPAINTILPPQPIPPSVSGLFDFGQNNYNRKRKTDDNLFFKNKRFGSMDFGGSRKPFQAKTNISRTMKVDSSKIGMIIGSRGAKIRELQEESNAKIDIDKETKEIRITGNEKEVQHAENLITKIVQGDRNDSSTFQRRDRSMDNRNNSFGNGGGAESLEIDVPQNMVGRIIGKGGSNIRDLEYNSGAKIKMDRDSNRVYITGNEDDVKKAKIAIDDIINGQNNSSDRNNDRNNDYSSPDNVVTMNVEQSLVGRVIGRGGATIRDIREKSGAKINIDKETNEITISGDDYAVKTAQDEINRVVGIDGSSKKFEDDEWSSDRNNDRGGNYRSDNRDNDYSSSDTVVTMNVEQSLVGRVIGRGGATIKDLCEKSGAKINIDKQTNEITITGSEDQVKIAQDEINRVVGNNDGPSKRFNDDPWSSDRNNDRGGDFKSDNDYCSSETVTMNVDQSLIGRVIGRGGATIKDLCEKSGAKINIDKQTNEITITGDADQVKIAQDEINRVVGNNDGSSKKFNDNPWSSDRNNDRGGDFRSDNDYSSSETVTMNVDQSLIGRVIGRGGATIKDLCEKSGAKINIDKQTNEITITGDADQVKIAQDEINRVVGNNEGSSKKFNDDPWSSDRNNDRGGDFRSDNDYSSSETVTMNVDQSLIGRVIGRGGATIKDLCEKSGAKINIDKQTNEITITGDADQVKIAQDEINRVVGNNDGPSKKFNDNPWSSDRNNDRGGDFRSDNDYSSSETVTMNVDQSLIGRVIGRGGATIKDLCEKSGAKINIDKQTNEITITGSEDQVKIAQDEINRVVSNNDGPSRRYNNDDSQLFQRRERTDNNPFNDRDNDYSSSDTVVTMNVEQSLIGRVIGRGGATINDLREKSGAKINIDKQSNEITITGNEDEVKIAQDEINRVIGNNDGSSKRFNDDSQLFQRRERSDNYSDESSFKMTVESSMIGGIIGRGGSKINELQSDSGARIKIDRITNEITISGSDSAIENAKEAIKNILDGNRPKSPVYNPSPSKIDDEYEIIDWEKVNKECDKANAEKWAKCPPLTKNFYEEAFEVANMSQEEVDTFREENNNIVVDRTFKDDNKPVIPIPNPVTKFEQCFAKYPDLMEQLQKQNFVKPSPIQSQAWPVLLKGEDLIGIAQTGTGKTLAFLLPAMIHTEYQSTPRGERGGPNVLVMAPTRELAIQIEKEVQKYQFRNMKAACLYGGAGRNMQIELIKSGVEIIICTPGRLNDLVSAGYIDIASITYLVLDEADRMLDMGFEPQIRKLLLDIRPDRQTVMTSATWPPGVRRLAQSYMNNPVQVYVGTLDLAACHSVTQLIEILPEEEKIHRIMDFVTNMSREDKAIIFCGKKARADDLASDFCLKGVRCQSLHGNRDQADREQALADIKSGEVRILVATDVASRGIDIEDITHVINYDFPRNIEEYVHRVGRTGRAGRTGISLSFFTREDWAYAGELIKILEEADQEVDPELREMTKRFEAKKEKNAREKAAFGGGGGRGGGGGFGGGFGGGRGGGGGGGRRDRW